VAHAETNAWQIVIDSREKQPLEGFRRETYVEKLDIGDYAISGFEKRIAVERKGRQEIFTCCGTDIKRFRKQLKNMQQLEYPYLLVEATIDQLLAGSRHSEMPGSAVVRKLVELQIQYGFYLALVDSRDAAKYVELIFDSWYDYYGPGNPWRGTGGYKRKKRRT